MVMLAVLVLVLTTLAQVTPGPAASAPPGTPEAPAASASAAPVYGFTFTPPDAAADGPHFVLIQLNSNVLHSGGPIDIKVTTSPDIVKVTTGSGSRQGALGQSGPGVFVSEATLPHVVSLIHVHIKLHFTAYTADGKTISVDVPVVYA